MEITPKEILRMFFEYQFSVVKYVADDKCKKFENRSVQLAREIIARTPDRSVKYYKNMQMLFSGQDVIDFAGPSFLNGTTTMVTDLTQEYQAVGLPESASFEDLGGLVGSVGVSRIDADLKNRLVDSLRGFQSDQKAMKMGDPPQQDASCMVGKNHGGTSPVNVARRPDSSERIT